MAQSKQWFIDQIGKTVFRDPSPFYSEYEQEVFENGVEIRSVEQAIYMFDIQNDFAAEGVNLNYRDEK